MAYLTAAVVVAIVLCCLDLVLTMGLIRRLRDHSRLLADVSSHSGGRGSVVPRQDIMLHPGQTPEAFQVTTTAGETLASGGIVDGTVIAFLSAGCSACEEQLAELVEHAGRGEVVAVVTGSGPKADSYVETLSPLATVVHEPDPAVVSHAYKVFGFPTYAVLAEGGMVVAASYRLSELPLRVPQ
jgi:hypothetical protein